MKIIQRLHSINNISFLLTNNLVLKSLDLFYLKLFNSCHYSKLSKGLFKFRFVNSKNTFSGFLSKILTSSKLNSAVGFVELDLIGWVFALEN